MLNKPIFSFLKEKFSSDNYSSENEGIEQNVERKEILKQKIDFTKAQLQRSSLRPPQCLGYSQMIAQSKGYSSLNENERYLVEKLNLLPESFLYIKKKIIERICIEGKIDPPNIPNGRHENFWFSLERYVRTNPENQQMYFTIVRYIGKFLIIII